MDKENPRNSPAFPRIETHRKEINHEELTQILILMFRLGGIFRTLGLNLIFYKKLAINILSQPAMLSQVAGIEMSISLDTKTVSCCGELPLW